MIVAFRIKTPGYQNLKPVVLRSDLALQDIALQVILASPASGNVYSPRSMCLFD